MAKKVELYGFFKSTKNGRVFQTQNDWVEKTSVEAGTTVVALDEDEDEDVILDEFVVASVGSPFQPGMRGKEKVYLYTDEKVTTQPAEIKHVDGSDDSAIFAR